MSRVVLFNLEYSDPTPAPTATLMIQSHREIGTESCQRVVQYPYQKKMYYMYYGSSFRWIEPFQDAYLSSTDCSVRVEETGHVNRVI